LTLMLFFNPYVTAQAGTEAHGGDVVRCSSSAENGLNGIFALDYVAGLDLRQQPTHPAPVNSWTESKQRLMDVLKWKAPALLSSFQEFASSVETNGLLGKRIWRGGFGELVQLADEELVRHVPANCRTFTDQGRPQAIQAVIRQQLASKLVYEYDESILRELDSRPLQYSFLMVHEWLWDHFKSAAVIRQVNHFLHSTEIEQLTAIQVQAILKEFGLNLESSNSNYFQNMFAELIRADDVDSIVRLRRELNGLPVFSWIGFDLLNKSGRRIVKMFLYNSMGYYPEHGEAIPPHHAAAAFGSARVFAYLQEISPLPNDHLTRALAEVFYAGHFEMLDQLFLTYPGLAANMLGDFSSWGHVSQGCPGCYPYRLHDLVREYPDTFGYIITRKLRPLIPDLEIARMIANSSPDTIRILNEDGYNLSTVFQSDISPYFGEDLGRRIGGSLTVRNPSLLLLVAAAGASRETLSEMVVRGHLNVNMRFSVTDGSRRWFKDRKVSIIEILENVVELYQEWPPQNLDPNRIRGAILFLRELGAK